MPKGKMALVLTPLTEQSLVNKSINYEIITRCSNDFAGKKRARIQAESEIPTEMDGNKTAESKSADEQRDENAAEEKKEVKNE